ncbi:MAG: thiamine pyrophosphate-binding protein [Chloroflexi bacterium]|nr:thiamine pyrophosphate-binding protein [Chloroflexota bacterium]
MQRAQAIAEAGGLEEALCSETLPRRIDATLSEALVLGLLRQGVRTFVGVFGHGSTEIAEVLRIYEEAGLVRTFGVRSEIEASHAAAALRWVTGEKAAVFTSIGPGALQALAGSLTPLTDRIGVWYLLGDETTEDEGPNFQQIPGAEQGRFLRLFSALGRAYSLHTPPAVSTALRRGLNTVDHPHQAGPFYLLMPMNEQPSRMSMFNLDELPVVPPPRTGAAPDEGAYARAAEALLSAERVVVRVGGGAREAGPELLEFLELADGVAVVSPIVSGVIPYHHRRNMLVGGSKGSICGNFAMEQADLLVAIGTRFVCQSDSSRTAYPCVRQVININIDVEAATHYGRAMPFVGDAGPTLARLNEELRKLKCAGSETESRWLRSCVEQRQRWEAFKAERYATPALYDEVWGEEVLTQIAVIKAATDWARAHDVATFFDSGDVQANGFQIVEDDRLGRTFSDTGASYMGFSASALLATGLSERRFYGLAIVGDGSFTMNPQILIDGTAHGANGCVLVLDNRRMAAISALQAEQYGAVYATSDDVATDYVAWARSVPGVAAFDGGRSPEALVAALDRARQHTGISLIHVPVYYGPNPLGGLGAFGRWNVGNWVEETQALRHEIGL